MDTEQKWESRRFKILGISSPAKPEESLESLVKIFNDGHALYGFNFGFELPDDHEIFSVEWHPEIGELHFIVWSSRFESIPIGKKPPYYFCKKWSEEKSETKSIEDRIQDAIQKEYELTGRRPNGLILGACQYQDLVKITQNRWNRTNSINSIDIFNGCKIIKLKVFSFLMPFYNSELKSETDKKK